jgi:hypothetical protein
MRDFAKEQTSNAFTLEACKRDTDHGELLGPHQDPLGGQPSIGSAAVANPPFKNQITMARLLTRN